MISRIKGSSLRAFENTRGLTPEVRCNEVSKALRSLSASVGNFTIQRHRQAKARSFPLIPAIPRPDSTDSVLLARWNIALARRDTSSGSNSNVEPQVIRSLDEERGRTILTIEEDEDELDIDGMEVDGT